MYGLKLLWNEGEGYFWLWWYIFRNLISLHVFDALSLLLEPVGGKKKENPFTICYLFVWLHCMPTCSNMGNRVLLLYLWGSNRQRLPGYKVTLLASFPIKLQICECLVRLLMGGKIVLQDLKLVPLQRHVPVNSGCSQEGTSVALAVVAVLHLGIKKAGLESWFGLANCCCPLWIFFPGFIWRPVTLELCLILISLATFVRQKLIKLSFHQLGIFPGCDPCSLHICWCS